MLRTKLSVNLNKVALLRNSREGNWPDPVFFGRIALAAWPSQRRLEPQAYSPRSTSATSARRMSPRLPHS